MRATASLFFCLLTGAGAGALAQTSDIMSLTVGLVCRMESGAAARLCTEYCTEMTCYRANDGDDATEPEATTGECNQARTRFKSLTGREVPCEEMIACPCADPSKWDDLATGMLWQSFAREAPSAEHTSCSDDASQTELRRGVSDVAVIGSAVDTTLGECRVVDGNLARPVRILRVSGSEARVCQRLLRRAAGSICR